MVEFLISAAQALSLAALLYGAYFVLLRGPRMARTPEEARRLANNPAGYREIGRD